MPRPKKSVPTYSHHKPTNTARCWVSGRWVSLGRYDSPESRAAFARVLAELAGSPPPVAVGSRSAAGVTVAELLVAFMRHAEHHYRHPDGQPTDEVNNFRVSLRPLRDLFAHLPAAEFGPKAMKAVRQRMIDLGWCRGQINRRTNRIRQVFKWAASEELVPAAVFQSLQTVTGLRAGRSSAVERDPVKPVGDATVDATLPVLNRHVRGLVEFQRLTGCRPGEACRLRWCDLETSGGVWLYRPRQHKTAWRGKARVVAVGPRAQKLIAEFRTADPSDYLFSPRLAVAEVRAARAAARKTPRSPSQVKRDAGKRVGEPKRRPAAVYTVMAYDKAVRRAAAKAGVEHWHPNRLRHSFATAVRAAHGIEAAQVALGHAHLNVSEVYAAKNLDLAVAVAAAVG